MVNGFEPFPFWFDISVFLAGISLMAIFTAAFFSVCHHQNHHHCHYHHPFH
jgi:hypothetical protein